MSAAANGDLAPPAGSTPDQRLRWLCSQATLSPALFESSFAELLREGQREGECRRDWEAMRHLLALRFQSVFEDFRAADPASTAAASTEWMCAECRAGVDAAAASGNTDAANTAHCRRSEQDEESVEVRYQRMMHMLIAFYKPPFTFQRMCDLLLEPKRYCKNTSKFLLAFSKLVCGINCDIVEDAFNVNWTDAKDASLGLPAVSFTTREEDEFGLMAPAVAPAAAVAAAADASRSIVASVATHAILPSQHFRVGMSAADMTLAQQREHEAKERLANPPQQQDEGDAAKPADDATMEQAHAAAPAAAAPVATVAAATTTLPGAGAMEE